MAAVRESIAHLFSLGEYEDVRVHAAARRRVVALTYDLVPLRPIPESSFTGTSAAGIDRGPAAPSGRATLRHVAAHRRALADIEGLVLDDLKEAGYLARRGSLTRIEPQRAERDSVLAVSIVPGDRTTVGTIDVEGDPGMPVAEFLNALDSRRRRRRSSGERSTRASIVTSTTRGSRGFYAARVSLTRRNSTDNDRTVNLTVTIVPGPHVTVMFVGDPLPNDRRDELVPIAREGSTDEDRSRGCDEPDRGASARQGYRDATAPHSRDEAQRRDCSSRSRQERAALPRRPDRRLGQRVDVADRSAAASAHPARTAVFRRGARMPSATLIEDLYHREGFASAQASIRQSKANPLSPAAVDVPVAIRIAITENARTIVERVSIEGNATVPETDLRSGLRLQPGRPFSANAAGDRSRRAAAAARQSRISIGDGRRPIRASVPTAAAPTCCLRCGRASASRRSRAHRRQRADEDRDHRARAAVPRPASRSGSSRSTRASAGWRRSDCSGACASPSWRTATSRSATCW